MERLRHVQVHPPTKEGREVILDLRQREVCVPLPRFELYEDVDVALRPEVVAEHGPEHCQPPDVVVPAKIGDPILGQRDAHAARCHGSWMIFRLSMPRSSTISTAVQSR